MEKLNKADHFLRIGLRVSSILFFLAAGFLTSSGQFRQGFKVKFEHQLYDIKKLQF